MLETANSVHPQNRTAANIYLALAPMWNIEPLLRSTRDHAGTTAPELKRLTEDYTDMEQTRIEKNLESVSYRIDASATVALITRSNILERVSWSKICRSRPDNLLLTTFPPSVHISAYISHTPEASPRPEARLQECPRPQGV